MVMADNRPISNNLSDVDLQIKQLYVSSDDELHSGFTEEVGLSSDTTMKSENLTRPREKVIAHSFKPNTTNVTRVFKESWVHTFPWLRYDKFKNTMSCSSCEEANAATIWRKGISLMKKDNIVRHAASNTHMNSLKFCKSQGRLARSKSKSVSTAALQNDKGVLLGMKNIYWLAKENIVIDKFASLHNHINTILEQYGKGRSIEFSRISDNPSSVFEMVEVMSEVLELELISKIKLAKHFSLFADVSSEISIGKRVIIYCRYTELPQYEVSTKFLKILNVKDESAQSVFDEISDYLNKGKINLENLVGWASNGESIMLGHNNGVQDKLKNLSPCLVSIHALGHSENLAIVDAYENVKYLKYTVETTLCDIFSYFCLFRNTKEELNMLQDLFEEPELQIKKVYDIRWLARSDCVDAIRKSFKSLMELFRENTNNTLAFEIYNRLTSYKFLLVFHAVCDIINNLTVLSKFLQNNDLHPYDISPVVNSTINNIENSFASEECNSLLGGLHVSTLHNFFKDSGYPEKFNGCLIHYQNFGKVDEYEAVSIIKTFSKNVVNSLKLRFSDLKYFDNWKIFDPNLFPNDKQLLVQHGMKELKQICKFYCHPVSGVFDWKFDDVQGEFQIFKEYVQKDAKNLQLIELCNHIILRYDQAFPHITQLMKLCLALPVVSVDCERNFLQQDFIETATEKNPAIEHLNALLRIRLNGPLSEKFNFNEAVAMYQKKMDHKKADEEVFDNAGIFEMSCIPPSNRNDAKKKKRFKKNKPIQLSSSSNSSSSNVEEDSSDNCVPSSNIAPQRKFMKQLKGLLKNSKSSQMEKMENLLSQQEKIISQQQNILACQSSQEEEIRELKFGTRRATPIEQSLPTNELTQTSTEKEDLTLKIASLISTIIPKDINSQNQSNSFQPPTGVRKICQSCGLDLTHTPREFQTQHVISCLNTLSTKSPSQPLKSSPPKSAKVVSGSIKKDNSTPERPPLRKSAKRQRELLSSVMRSMESDKQKDPKIKKFKK